MITKFKLFENLDREPEVGDWVLMTHWWAGQHLHRFIDSTPGEVISKNVISTTTTSYEIRFGSVGDTYWLDDNFGVNTWIKEFNSITGFQDIDKWIKYIFKDKEEVELFVVAKKYNL